MFELMALFWAVCVFFTLLLLSFWLLHLSRVLAPIFQKNREQIEFMVLFWAVFLSFTLLLLSFWLGFLLGILAPTLLYIVRHPKLLADKHLRSVFNFLKDRQPDKHMAKYVNVLVALYCTFLLFSLLANGIFLLPEQMLFFGLVGAVYLGKGKKFIRDWLPLVMLILAYEAMRGTVSDSGPNVHYYEMIDADKAIFGVIPTVYLQALFFTPGVVAWYDILAAMIYLLHFSAPLLLAYLFWCEGREELFRRISSTIVVLSYSGLIIFLLYPAAPPWLAAENGYLLDAHQVLGSLSETIHFRALWTVYILINPNRVAAMPSLHAAYPIVVYLFIRKRWGANPLSHLAILFPLAMALSLIYLGEHYAIDVIAGFILALVTYFFVGFVYDRQKKIDEARSKKG